MGAHCRPLGSPHSDFLPLEPQAKHGARHVTTAVSPSWTNVSQILLAPCPCHKPWDIPSLPFERQASWTTVDSYSFQGPPQT